MVPGLFTFSRLGFPLFFPYEPLHPVGALPAHALGHMAVDVQSKGCGAVAKIFQDGLNVIPALQC